jgi:hypothetical protein
MIVSITFKSPDSVFDAINDAVWALKKEGKSTSFDVREDIIDKLSKFIRYNEVVTIDFDLDANTATVRKV